MLASSLIKQKWWIVSSMRIKSKLPMSYFLYKCCNTLTTEYSNVGPFSRLPSMDFLGAFSLLPSLLTESRYVLQLLGCQKVETNDKKKTRFFARRLIELLQRSLHLVWATSNWSRTPESTFNDVR